MKIQTGIELMGNIKPVESDSVSFMTDDGREMFQVSCRGDGMSIEVRGVEMSRHFGKLYSSTLVIEPKCANVICIRTMEYGE